MVGLWRNFGYPFPQIRGPSDELGEPKLADICGSCFALPYRGSIREGF